MRLGGVSVLLDAAAVDDPDHVVDGDGGLRDVGRDDDFTYVIRGTVEHPRLGGRQEDKEGGRTWKEGSGEGFNTMTVQLEIIFIIACSEPPYTSLRSRSDLILRGECGVQRDDVLPGPRGRSKLKGAKGISCVSGGRSNAVLPQDWCGSVCAGFHLAFRPLIMRP